MKHLFWLALLGAVCMSCFDDITLATCAIPADCPGDAPVCEEGYCLHRSAGCDGAAATPGDGCCPLGPVDRMADSDCVRSFVSLEGKGFAGPSISPETGAAFVAVLRDAAAEAGGDAQDKILLLRIDQAGGLGELGLAGGGSLEHLAPPLVSKRGVWVGFDLGIRRFDPEGGENGLIADAPRAGRVAVGPDGCIAWWARLRDGLGIAWPDSDREAVFWPIERASPDAEPALLGPAFVEAGTRAIAIADGRLRLFDASTGDAMGELELGTSEGLLDLCASRDTAYVLGAEGSLWAIASDEAQPRLRWSVQLEAGASGECYVDGLGHVLVPSVQGSLTVVEARDDGATQATLTLPWSGTVGASIWLASGVGVFQGAEGQLRMIRLPDTGGSIVEEGWRHRFANGFIAGLAADAEGFVSVMDGAGVLTRVQSGVLGDPAAYWPGAGGPSNGSGSASLKGD